MKTFDIKEYITSIQFKEEYGSQVYARLMENNFDIFAATECEDTFYFAQLNENEIICVREVFTPNEDDSLSGPFEDYTITVYRFDDKVTDDIKKKIIKDAITTGDIDVFGIGWIVSVERDINKYLGIKD